MRSHSKEESSREQSKEEERIHIVYRRQHADHSKEHSYGVPSLDSPMIVLFEESREDQFESLLSLFRHFFYFYHI